MSALSPRTAAAVGASSRSQDYFSSVFIDEGEYTQGYNDKVNMVTGLGDTAISRDAVLKKLQRLQMDKAQGPDDIHLAVLKNCAEIISLPLTLIYEKSLYRKENYQLTGKRQT